MDEDNNSVDPPDGPLIEIDRDTLQMVHGIAQIVAKLDWFGSLGISLPSNVGADANAYLNALGFSDLGVAPILDWQEARTTLENRDWDTAWADAEQQTRAAVADDAIHLCGEDVVTAAVNFVSEQASRAADEALQGASGLLGGDPQLIEAATADARDMACQVLLVALAEQGADHPLALKFRLFEAGRWPVGVIGSSFNLF